MLKALQIGAGNIGRGFLGHILFESGFQTTFIDANPGIVSLLQERHEYPLRLVGPRDADEDVNLTIGNVNAINPRADHQAAVEAIVQADVAGTSVGVGALPHVAPVLAAGIGERARLGRPVLNILLCENQQHCSVVMRDLLLPHIKPEALDYFNSQIGLVETVIGRMVPVPTPTLLAEDSLLVAAEPYMELPLAASMVRGTLPQLKSVILAETFAAYEARKLFMHNAGHAALAYLGYLNGQTYIWESAQDPLSRAVCETALEQVAQAMVRAFPNTKGMDGDSLNAYVADLLTRFENKKLGDTIVRVAADPIRKLRSSDRLIGAAQFCLENGIQPTAIVTILAAALRFDYEGDVSAAKLQQMRRHEGDAATISQLCELEDSDQLKHDVLHELQTSR